MKIKRLLASLALGLGVTLAFLWLLVAGPLAPVYADTYTVTNTNASGPGSLRQAILDANGNPGHDTISFGITGTIVLTDALPPIGDDLTISGPGVEQLAISGANAYRVFSITTGIAVTITRVTVRDGNVANSNGGGVWSAGTLHLDSVEIIGNNVSGSWPLGRGGGVYIYEGSATLSGTQVVSNSASSGGGVYVWSGSATLNMSSGEVRGNSVHYGGGGGGVDINEGSATLSGTQVVGNSAWSGGGGVLVRSGSATLIGTQVVGNSADSGGGVCAWSGGATLNVSGGWIGSNVAWYGGGGVYVFDGSATLSGTQVVNNSTFFSSGGGVYVDRGSATLSGTQVVSNSADYDGGGVYIWSGNAMLNGGRIAGNDAPDGSGMYQNGGAVTLTAPLTVTGEVYQAGGTFVGSSNDLHIEGSLRQAGGHFYAPNVPNDFILTGPFTHTGGTYHQTRVVTGSGDVGFPKAGGVILNANSQNLDSVEVALTAGVNCAGVTAGEAVTHCYMVTPTVATERDAIITFYYNNSEVPVNHSCAAMEAFRWDSTWNNLLTRDGSYGTGGRMCDGDSLSIRVTGVTTFSPFVLKGLLAPEITVLPLSVLFGEQDVDAGATVSQTVTITNDGTADLHISAVIPTGDMGEFNLADSGEITLASGSTRTMGVSFDPSSVGGKVVTLTVQSDDSDEGVVNVALSGTGTVAPEIAVDSLSLVFGDQDVNAGPTASQTMTITNGGSAALHVTGISLTGDDPSEFVIESGGDAVTLTQGSTHIVRVSFDPATAGAKSASLTIQSDDSDEATVDVVLSGTGIVANLIIAKSVTPTIAALGDTITYTIVISNAGDATASGVVMTDPLPSAVSFGNQSKGTALVPLPDDVYRWGPYNIAAHTAYTITCTANVTDNADFAGQTITNTAYVTATNTALDSDDAVFTIIDIAQAGYGSDPAPGSSINVGTANVGSTVSTSLTISETGEATLMVTPTLSGADAAAFGFAPTTLTILNGGAAQDLTISCTPSFTGTLGTLARTLAATLTVAHNAPGSPAVYPLSCTGEAQRYIYLPLVLRNN